MYQTMEETVYHVAQGGVEAIQSSPSPKPHFVAFVDGDKGASESNQILFSPLVQIIVASYTKSEN